MNVYAVSKVKLDGDGRVTDVHWGRVDTEANAWVDGETGAPVAEVVRAIDGGADVYALFPSEHGHLPERRFRVVDYENGLRTVALDGEPSFQREVHDMDRLGD